MGYASTVQSSQYISPLGSNQWSWSVKKQKSAPARRSSPYCTSRRLG